MNEDNMVWVITFETGEYYDREVFIAGCFDNHDKALAFVNKKNEEVQAVIDAKCQPKDPSNRDFYRSRTAEYPFDGVLKEVRSYRNEMCNAFSVNGPFKLWKE